MELDDTLLLTGGAGFIGSALIRYLIAETKLNVVNIDKLTYAGNLDSLESVQANQRYHFQQTDICNSNDIRKIFNHYRPQAIMHLAAESHVDRSIDGPLSFIQTNITGTAVLLEEARRYWLELDQDKKEQFRFHHISTDEVYGTLGKEGLFTETTRYDPSSPYSASKASSDHLVRAWNRTYGLPVVISNCSNNYGPFQFPEKLIPLIIQNALEGKVLPIYGKGDQIRDWLYVDDHARALYQVLTNGRSGETYNIGSHNEKTNLDVVTSLCALLDELVPERPDNRYSYTELITHVKDRPGHDQRYAIDTTKTQQELGWVPKETFETGLRKTVNWYLQHQTWCRRVQDGSYRRERLGLCQNDQRAAVTETLR